MEIIKKIIGYLLSFISMLLFVLFLILLNFKLIYSESKILEIVNSDRYVNSVYKDFSDKLDLDVIDSKLKEKIKSSITKDILISDHKLLVNNYFNGKHEEISHLKQLEDDLNISSDERLKDYAIMANSAYISSLDLMFVGNLPVINSSIILYVLLGLIGLIVLFGLVKYFLSKDRYFNKVSLINFMVLTLLFIIIGLIIYYSKYIFISNHLNELIKIIVSKVLISNVFCLFILFLMYVLINIKFSK